jgi:GLPGLI family protein
MHHLHNTFTMRKLVSSALLLLSIRAAAQDSTHIEFIHSGTIEYERKENLRNEFTGESEFAEQYRKLMPENKISYFNLAFNDNQSLFQPGRENPDNVRLWDAPGSTNIVYADRKTNRQVSQKNAYGSSLLVADTLRRLTWRITADTRVIAGFECHRATTVIMDSVFVVAFYTDEILASSGPESFGGLPGMIMGLVVPKLHTSWYATKIILGDPINILPPKKGKKMNTQEMFSELNDVFKDWGDWGKPMIMRLML